MRAFVAALVLLGSCELARAGERFALVIGANAGWSNDRPLRYAEADAERVRAVLVELGGFPPDRVVLLRDPDTAEVRASLRRLGETLRAMRGDSIVLVYYSGHADARHLHLRGAPLSQEEIYRTLRDLRATVRIGVLDACKSGSILAAKGGKPAAEFEIDVVDEMAVSGVAFLTSSDADELSQESRALAGSVFTHHFVSALRGAADADRDGKVTLAEAYHHAFERTRADTAATRAPQRPSFRFDLKGQGEIVLSRTLAAAAVMLPREESRRYVIVDKDEWQLVAEAASRLSENVTLALLPGEYRVKRVLPDRIEVATLVVAPGQRVGAGTLAYAARSLSTGMVKGRPDEKDPAELREWQRGEAFRLLAEGEAGAALAIFDQILVAKPDDVASLRGKARAMVRMAEAYDRVSDRQNERLSLRAALSADPSLAEDPDFKAWYQRLKESEAAETREAEIKAEVMKEVRDNPRLTRRFGLGFDFVSPRGAAVLVGTLILRRIWFPYLGLTFFGPGLDFGSRLIPFPWKWSPFVGVGAHASFKTLGLPHAEDEPVTVNEGEYTNEELFGKNLHLDIGVQYFGSSGFSAELGVGIVLFERAMTEKTTVIAFPILNIGWYF